MCHPNERHTLVMEEGVNSPSYSWCGLATPLGDRDCCCFRRGYKALQEDKISTRVTHVQTCALRSATLFFLSSISHSLFCFSLLLLSCLYESEYRWNQRSSRGLYGHKSEQILLSWGAAPSRCRSLSREQGGVWVVGSGRVGSRGGSRRCQQDVGVRSVLAGGDNARNSQDKSSAGVGAGLLGAYLTRLFVCASPVVPRAARLRKKVIQHETGQIGLRLPWSYSMRF